MKVIEFKVLSLLEGLEFDLERMMTVLAGCEDGRIVRYRCPACGKYMSTMWLHPESNMVFECGKCGDILLFEGGE
jgi:predicted RNA-binding Zn-ribbon protein involved in translation (DUF1610 family)